MNPSTRLAVLFLLAIFATEGAAATFCVSDGDELRTALNTASNNGEDDTIRVRGGDFTASSGAVAFAYTTSEPNDLTVEGGWQAFNGGDNCLFRINSAELTRLSGSNVRRAVFLYGLPGAGDITVSNLTIENGQYNNGAGGAHIGGSGGYLGDISIHHVVFRYNTGTIGGAVESGADGGRLEFVNNLIYGNSCSNTNCAASLTVNDPSNTGTFRAELLGNTIVSNFCTGACSVDGLRIGGSAIVRVANNLFSGHLTDLHIDAQHHLLFNNVVHVTGVAPITATGNVALVNPGFINAAHNNYRLHPGSPLVDFSNAVLPLPSSDLDGNPRVHNSITDLGAYESQSNLFRNGFE